MLISFFFTNKLVSARFERLYPGVGGALLEILGGEVPHSSPNRDLISDQKMSFSHPFFRPGTRFSKAPITNWPVKLLLFTFKIEV